MTVSDETTTPEARAAIAAAARVVPTFDVDPTECDHDAPIVIGKHFENDQHTYTVSRCPQCGTEFVTEETA